MKVVLIFSGGVDSSTLLYHLLAKQYTVQCLSFDYGQRHRKELDHAKNIASLCKTPWKCVDFGSLKLLLSRGALTGDSPVPHGHYEKPIMKETIVPNRNMIMLSLAIAWALTLGYDAVSYAAHGGDHAIYPDCRKEFVDAMALASRLADWKSIKLLTPYLECKKENIIKEGMNLKVPYELTWSCYEGGKVHCGKCGTCQERKEAFSNAGVLDPTQYDLS